MKWRVVIMYECPYCGDLSEKQHPICEECAEQVQPESGKTDIEEILSKYVDKKSMDELSENVWPDIVDAMKEYALQVAREAVEAEKHSMGDKNPIGAGINAACDRIILRIEKLMEES